MKTLALTEKEVHFSNTQLKAIVVNARKTFCVWHRGSGKTTSVMAWRQQHLAHVMPRGSFLFVGESFTKIKDDFIPKWRVGWERLGFKKDEHYWINEKPPAEANVPEAYFPVDEFKNVITWYTGAVLHLVSLDRNASNKLGIDCDAIDDDECKTLDWPRYKTEISPTRRGNFNRWGHLPEYGSEWFYTDKYIGEKHSDWFFQFRDKSTPDLVELILLLQNKYQRMIAEAETKAELQKLQEEIRHYQCNCIHFHEPTKVDNVEVLRYQYFKEQSENLTPTELLTAIFNEDIKKIEGGFYFMLDEYLHGYTAPDGRDCLPDLPLEVGVDWGGNFNCMAVHQTHGKNIKLLKTFHVQVPQKYDVMFDEFDKYYRNHKKKVIHAYTGHDGDNQLANSKYTFNQDMERMLTAKGWKVIILNRDMAALGHNLKYKIWKKVLDRSPKRDDRYPTWSYNNENSNDAFVSMAKAPVKVIRNGLKEEIKKDKKSEDPKVQPNQVLATHLSDAVDNVVCYKCKGIEKQRRYSK